MTNSKQEEDVRSLHVGQFIDSMDPGGAEMMVINLAQGLVARGFRVTVFHFGNSWLAEQIALAGLASVVVNPRYYRSTASLPLFVFRFSRILREHGINVLHCHLLGAIFAGSLAARLAKIPAIGTMHDSYSAAESQMNRRYLRWAQYMGCRLIAVCDAMRDELVRLCRLRPIDRIYNGIDVERYDQGKLSTYSKMPVQIICVARAVPVKRIDRLLFAAARIDATVPFKLMVVGDGPSLTELKELAIDLGVYEHVSFTGHRSDIPQLLADSDIFVLVSDSEGLSVSILESMASGLPCIATDVGGNRELIVDGQSGYIVEKDNDTMLYQRILELAQCKEERVKFGNIARNRARNEFNRAAMCDEYASTIRSTGFQRA